MSPSDQATAFQRDLEALISRYAAEFNLSVAQAIGVLELVKLDLYHSQLDNE